MNEQLLSVHVLQKKQLIHVLFLGPRPETLLVAQLVLWVHHLLSAFLRNVNVASYDHRSTILLMDAAFYTSE